MWQNKKRVMVNTPATEPIDHGTPWDLEKYLHVLPRFLEKQPKLPS